MMFKICYIIAEVILYFSILEWITHRKIHKSMRYKVFCSGMLALMEITLILQKDNIFSETFFAFLCMLWLFIYLCLSDRKNGWLYKFSMVISTIMIDAVYTIILTLPCSYLCLWISGNRNVQLVREFFALAYVITSICFGFFADKLPLYKLFESRGMRVISTIIGTGIIILQQIGFHLARRNQSKVNIIIANFLIFTVVIGILWLLDHYRLAARKLKVEQDNREMNSNLHKTKELMPLLISVINENEGLLDPQLVEEFNQIYSEQMIAGRKENMNYKLLGTTGIKLLDSQLQHYILECSKKGIVMDVFASEPVGKKLHKMQIPQIMLHNIVGDLLRNAIRAIERSGRTDGKILVIIGRKEKSIEMDIFDNGEEIPFEVLEKFGERGITTGGTGNGLADMNEIIADYGISLVIKENMSEGSTYAKGFMLIFDGQNRRELITDRAGKEKLEELGIWKIISEETPKTGKSNEKKSATTEE